MHTEVEGEHGMDRKVSGGIVEITNPVLTSQQQSKRLYRSPKKGSCIVAGGGQAAADD